MKNILLCALFATIMLGCKTTEKSAVVTTDTPLIGTTWQLTNVYCEPIAESPVTPTMIFDNEGKVSGTLGCNTFFGEYSCRKDKISVSYMGSTKKLCSDMELEKKYATALHDNLTHFVIVDNILIIKSKNTEVLRFKAQ